MDLTGSYLIVPISMVIMIVMNWLDRKNKKKNYLKNSIVTGILVAFAVYLNNIPQIEDIISDPPAF